MIDIGNSYTIGIMSKRITLYCKILSDYPYHVCRTAVKMDLYHHLKKMKDCDSVLCNGCCFCE
jgi:hypothetical protein